MIESRLQPVLSTRSKQLKIWCDLLVMYMKHSRRVLSLDVNDDHTTSELFHHATLKRTLSREGVHAVIEELVGQRYAIWQSRHSVDKNINTHPKHANASGAVVASWRSIDEWANILHAWASQSGNMNEICTLYELHEGDATNTEEFHGLDARIVLAACQLLESQRRASLLRVADSDIDTNIDEVGVKFLNL